MDRVDLLVTSPNINNSFDDDSNTNTPGTALGLLESISNKGPLELHKVCELPDIIPLCCKFSPCDMLLAVSGHGGQMTFYESRL